MRKICKRGKKEGGNRDRATGGGKRKEGREAKMWYVMTQKMTENKWGREHRQRRQNERTSTNGNVMRDIQNEWKWWKERVGKEVKGHERLHYRHTEEKVAIRACRGVAVCTPSLLNTNCPVLAWGCTALSAILTCQLMYRKSTSLCRGEDTHFTWNHLEFKYSTEMN